MSRRGEKIEAAHMEQVKELDIGQRSEHGSEQKEVIKAKVLSVALTDAVAKDNISKWSVNMLKLYGIMLLVTLNDCMNGYDGSLMGSINAMQPYHTYFNIDMQGGGTGIVFAIYSIGNLTGAPVAAFAADRFGRRFGMFSGCVFIVIGTIIEATARDIGAFMGGRFLIGFGISIAQTAAPVYLVEMAYPPWRGLFGGLYNVIGYYIGAIVCTWTTYGTGHLASDWSWRIPVIIQALPSLIVMAFVWFLPESPRWLAANSKADAAREILIKYHGNGYRDSAVAALEYNEILELLNYEAEMADKRWWDYRPLFSSRASLYRVWLLLLVTVFSQFIGGSVIAYYMPVMLENAGITSSSEQLLLNALNTIFSFLGGIVGSCFVERLGRRPLFLWATFLTGLCYIPINIIASRSDAHVGVGAGYTFIAFIFLYGIVFSFGWTPLQALYPAEILTNEMRAKGMAFQSLLAGLASFINLYATPVALQNIDWKTYTIFLVLHFVQLALMYQSIVETKGRSLEELEDIFNSPKPVKASLKRQTVVLKKGEGVKTTIEEG